MYKQEQTGRLFWIWLSTRLGAGNRLYPLLLERFGSAYEVFEASEERLLEVLPDLTPAQLRALTDKRLEDIYAIEEHCRRSGVKLLTYNDAAYPLSYRSLTDPPLLLYYRGELPDLQNKLCIAMVGTRRMSEYGRRMAYKIAYELAAAGVVVVSGMALGVDSVASCAALQAGGSTVAILGGGIDVPYPPEHESFMEIIAARGTLISEYAPGTAPVGSHFPVRNRLISGLCQGTVIVEAAQGSGALITADRALQQGRDVFAVPANVGDANASGTNRLIRDGAHVALCADDILGYYKFLYEKSVSTRTTAALGARSDYDGAVLARMGVYSRVVGGYLRVPAEEAGSAAIAPSPAPAAEPRRRAPAKRANDSKPDMKPTPKAPSERSRTAERTASVSAAQPEDKSPLLSPRNADDKGDRSCEAVASLTELQRSVLDAIPAEAPVSIDKLKRMGFAMGQLLSTLSVLEIKGLVQSLPGGMVGRR